MKTDKTCAVMIDGCGNAVPTKYVSAYDKMRDKQVRRIAAAARKLRTDLENFVIQSLAAMDEVRNLKDADKLGAKGNFQARSFDGLLCVEINQNYNLVLDERVNVAREKMLGYVERVLARVGGSDAQALKVIVEEAFRVGSNGLLSKGKVFALVRMEIKDPDWQAAQTILREAMSGERGKRYLNVYSRPDHSHGFKQIILNLADCWPVVAESEVAK